MPRACMVLLVAVSSTICLSAQSNAGGTTIGPRWNPQTANLPHYDWLYAGAIPPEARYQLLPLYQEAEKLLQELYGIRPAMLNEVASGLLTGTSEAGQAVEA